MITALYLCAAKIILLRYSSAIAHQEDVLDLFTASGIPQPQRPTVAGLLRYRLFTFGSLVAVLSVLFPKLVAKRSSST